MPVCTRARASSFFPGDAARVGDLAVTVELNSKPPGPGPGAALHCRYAVENCRSIDTDHYVRVE